MVGTTPCTRTEGRMGSGVGGSEHHSINRQERSNRGRHGRQEGAAGEGRVQLHLGCLTAGRWDGPVDREAQAP